MNYTTIASHEDITKTVEALKANGIEAHIVQTESEALSKIIELIPQGASVMNGSSRTLEQIGFVEYLKGGTHGWNNLHAGIVAETDEAKQAVLRKQAILSDYYLGSVHGLAQTGEFLVASNTGSQLPHIVYSSQNLIFVTGAQKIVPTLTDALNRLDDHVIPLENARMQGLYHMDTQLSKVVLFKKENPFMGRKVQMIIVNKSLGF